MLLLLPKEIDGLNQLEDSLSIDNLLEWRNCLHGWNVHIFLPKFKMNCQFRLDETLESMGMVDAFIPLKANFAGMTGNRDLFITFVIHKAFVDVNEEGTEAAAATAGAFGGPPPPPPVFRADHPFLFLIQDNYTGSIFFMGRVTDPTQSGQ
jgi:serpin B